MEYFELILWDVDDLRELDGLEDWDEYCDCVWNHSHECVARSTNEEQLIKIAKLYDKTIPLFDDREEYKNTDCEYFFTIGYERINLNYINDESINNAVQYIVHKDLEELRKNA